MTLAKRIRDVVLGVVMVLVAIAMIAVPEFGFPLIIVILCVTLTVAGVRRLIFYARMARHMVGGIRIFYTGILLLDAGLFTFTLTNIPHFYVMLYLIFINGLTGVIGLLRALEDRRQGMRSWKIRMIYGAVNVLFALACLLNIHSETLAVYIYGASLLYAAVMRIITAFRKTDIVYIA